MFFVCKIFYIFFKINTSCCWEKTIDKKILTPTIFSLICYFRHLIVLHLLHFYLLLLLPLHLLFSLLLLFFSFFSNNFSNNHNKDNILLALDDHLRFFVRLLFSLLFQFFVLKKILNFFLLYFYPELFFFL